MCDSESPFKMNEASLPTHYLPWRELMGYMCSLIQYEKQDESYFTDEKIEI